MSTKKLSLYAGEKNHLLIEYITKKGLWKPGLKYPHKNRWAPLKMDGEVVIVVELTRGYAMITAARAEVGELLRERCYCALVNQSGVRPFNSQDGYFYRHLMERLHGKIPEGQEVDHVDHNPLNNTRANLRIVSSSENKRNRRKHRNNSSGHPGVSWDESQQRWLVYCKVHGKMKKRSITPSKLGLSKEEALEEAIKWRKKFESEMGYHNF